MQKMLYIFRSKCSYGKLFNASRLFYFRGNSCQYWLSGHPSGNDQPTHFFTINSFFRYLYAILSGWILLQLTAVKISKTKDQAGITGKR
jgi:hypothetical protein